MIMWQIECSVTRLVSRHRGTLPVLLTCPHDGEQQPEGVPERTGSIPGCPPFRTSRDLRTREITTGIAQRLLELTGEAPSVVVAEFSRRFIDANRSAECAFKDPHAQPFYDEYHNTIRQFIGEIRAENGGLGLLFDIHGTAGIPEDPADLYLGTANGETIDRLRRADPRVLWRHRGLRGFLEDAGHVVSPKQPNIPETPAVSGGFTVRTYGSSHADGLDAIQIEIDARLRDDPDPRGKLIEDLAQAMARLVVLWADAHTLAAFRNIDLFTGDVVEAIAGQLRRDAGAGDWLLRLGGEPQNRGRVEIRRDPGGSYGHATPRCAGVLVLCGEDGNDHYLWVDNEGRLRISPSDPGEFSHAGVVVGAQTK